MRHAIFPTLNGQYFRSRIAAMFSAMFSAMFISGGLAIPVSAELIAIEPEAAGPDFSVQGEYVGITQRVPGTEAGLGAQVVAQGDGNFRVVFFPGGLPGEGWDKVSRFESAGIKGIIVTDITGEEYQGRLAGDSLKGADSQGGNFVLIKRNRVSPTLGLIPPPQATVLFDGTSLDGWDNASMDNRGYFAPLELVALSKKKFANFSMHLEFRVPFMPFAQGQGRGNSGLKILNGKDEFGELQILDSFGNEPRQDECGGIEVISPPDLVASFPPLTWQTYDIHLTTPVSTDTDPESFDRGSMTVWLNGILIHPARVIKPITPTVSLALQLFQGPVYFRNMWLVEGNDHYPFLPGAAVRPAVRKNIGPIKNRVGLKLGSKGHPISIEIGAPDRLYRPDGGISPNLH